MKKKKIKKSKITFMPDEEAKLFLKKYDQLIYFEAKKRTQLTGISTEDLMQECRIKLLSGFSSFDHNRSSEKTWVTHVIKKTLNTVWRQAFKKKRVNMIYDDKEKEIPIRDMSLESYSKFSEHSDKKNTFSFEETYRGPPDGRPAFGTTTYTPEESLEILEALKFLKTKLPAESYEIIRKELLPEIEQQIHPESKKIKYHLTDLDKCKEKINSLSSESGLTLWETQLMTQIADFFIDILGFNKKMIYGRMRTLDIVEK